jgi:hypothetical protein
MLFVLGCKVKNYRQNVRRKRRDERHRARHPSGSEPPPPEKQNKKKRKKKKKKEKKKIRVTNKKQTRFKVRSFLLTFFASEPSGPLTVFLPFFFFSPFFCFVLFFSLPPMALYFSMNVLRPFRRSDQI